MDKFEKKLLDIKQKYQDINSEFLGGYGWEDMKKRIEGRGERLPWRFGGRFLYLAGLVLIIVLFSGFVKVAAASLPGQPLYPVKRLGEEIIVGITRREDTQIEQRAKDIIDLSKQQQKNEKQMEQALEEYQKSVEEVQKKAEKSKEKAEEIKKKIEEQEKNIREIIEEEKERNGEIKKFFEEKDKDKDKENTRRDKEENKIETKSLRDD